MLARNQKYCVYLQSKRKINYKIMLVMKKQLLLFVLMILPMMASAEAVEIDGIYYNLNTESNQAEVTSNLNKYAGDVTIPDKITYEGYEYCVTSIRRGAFSSCSDLVSIDIPNSVTSIGESAFSGCDGLTSVTIPDGVISIEESAFGDCKA